MFAAARFKVAELASTLAITAQERSRGPGEDLPATLGVVMRLKDYGVSDALLWRLVRTPYCTTHDLMAAERATLGVDPIPADAPAAAPQQRASPCVPIAAQDPGQSCGAASTLIVATVGLGWLLRRFPSVRRSGGLRAAQRAVARQSAKRPLTLARGSAR